MSKVGTACKDPDCVNRIWVERGRTGGIWATHNKCLDSSGGPREMRFCDPDPTELAELIKDLKGLYLDQIANEDF